ncbi:MAG TPA: DinB family protein [Gemmataceae bacterium]|nr:DinB family protein [Gemmataceae bacterium]
MPYPTLESRADILKMLDEITEARKAILDRAGRLTAAQLNDPVYPGTWSVLKNLAHLAWAEAWMLAWIKVRPALLAAEQRPPEPALELAAIRTALDEAHAAVIAFLKGNSEGVLREKCVYSRKGEQTVGGVLFHLIEHEIHHRAFLLNKLGKLEAPDVA